VLVTPAIGSGNTFVLGFGFRLNAHTTLVNSGNQGPYCESGANEQFHLEFESSSGSGVRILIKVGTTTVGTSSYFAFGAWHYIEVNVTVRTGTYELRRNGVLDISDASEDMADTGSDGWDIFAWRFSSSLSSFLRIDDIYVCDGTGAKNNDFLGPSIVEGILPNAEGTTIQWTPATGTDNSAMVDDVGTSAPVDSVNYNGSDTNT
jgi:hypothetical protein